MASGKLFGTGSTTGTVDVNFFTLNIELATISDKTHEVMVIVMIKLMSFFFILIDLLAAGCWGLRWLVVSREIGTH